MMKRRGSVPLCHSLLLSLVQKNLIYTVYMVLEEISITTQKTAIVYITDPHLRSTTSALNILVIAFEWYIVEYPMSHLYFLVYSRAFKESVNKETNQKNIRICLAGVVKLLYALLSTLVEKQLLSTKH